MCGFLGAVNHYQHMWPQCTYILAPIFLDTCNGSCLQSDESTYGTRLPPCLSFHIYTDASSNQMGAYIVQDEKPVAFLSCKFNDAQLKYMV